MNRHEFEKIFKTSWNERKEIGMPIFDWEHCSKSFHWIPNDLAAEHFVDPPVTDDNDPLILKCKYDNETYYFGIELEDEITVKIMEKMLRNGSWSVYTWAD